MKNKIALFAVSMLFLLSACIEPPEYPDEPFITAVRMSKNQVVANDVNEVIIFEIDFEDGNGDISGAPDDVFDGIFIRDMRFDVAFPPFSVADEIDNSGNTDDIAGTFIVTYSGPIPCIGDEPQENFAYEVQILDRARNESNKVITQEITLFCE